jgi:ketosteroid isomerase-like protein
MRRVMSETPPFPSPQAAEAAFYQALEQADLQAMLSVWDEQDSIVCIHPMGQRIEGLESVAESWRRILRAGPRLRFRVVNVRETMTADLCVHLVDEVVTILEDGREALIHATNVYRNTPGGWRMVVHHASPTSSARREPAPAAPVVH